MSAPEISRSCSPRKPSPAAAPAWLRAALVLCAASAAALAQTSPEAHLGHPVGADFHLPDWQSVSAWYRDLDSASARVELESAGTTTDGREFLVCVVGSEANLARLEALREDARRIADPRGLSAERADELARSAVPVVMISNAMHSTEVAAPQFSMELCWKLATSEAEPWKSVREKALVVILPCTNPDGLDIVAHWYRDSVGKSFEGGSPPWLYQHYAGHDNNRDWFMLSLAETRIVSSLLYERWHPQVYWDVHQQGSFAERMFVPPFRDPLDPHLDPTVMGAIDLVGTRAALDMTARGLKGVASGVSFDMWWHGGNRNVPVRHNIIGLLTEAASANLASPLWVPADRLRAPSGLARYGPSNRFRDPWPGGWWRVRDIIDYEMAFAESLLGAVAREPQLYTRTVLEAARRTCELGPSQGYPEAWVLPASNADTNAQVRLCESLMRTQVEVLRAAAPFEADGRSFGAGSLVIPRGQPAWRHVHDLFDVQHYPGDEPPYDVAGWTLPALMGLEAVAVRTLPAGPRVRITRYGEAKADPEEGDNPRELDDIDKWRAVFSQLSTGAAALAASGESPSRKPRLPRVAVYKPWTASMDEGWLRWTLEYCGLEYRSVDTDELRTGALLERFDVLVLPDVSRDHLDDGREPGSVPEEYAGGLGREGRLAVETFVRGGGRIVCIGRASLWAVDLFQLPLEDAAHGKAAGDFSCPGSVLRARLEPVQGDSLAPPSARDGFLFFSGGFAWSVPESKAKEASGIVTLARYAEHDLLYSGWIRSPATIEGKSAWVRADIGKGRAQLFGFSPYYRSWSQANFHWLLRAIMDLPQ
ncbi:MAG: peptidase M14 [Planctomycetes bacterium]|nr:peptidase M14 [Planctomycetota bacterium]